MVPKVCTEPANSSHTVRPVRSSPILYKLIHHKHPFNTPIAQCRTQTHVVAISIWIDLAFVQVHKFQRFLVHHPDHYLGCNISIATGPGIEDSEVERVVVHNKKVIGQSGASSGIPRIALGQSEARKQGQLTLGGARTLI